MYQSLTIEEVSSDSELVFEEKYTQETIEVRYPGGKNNDQIEKVTDMVTPQVDKEGTYFVKNLNKTLYLSFNRLSTSKQKQQVMSLDQVKNQLKEIVNSESGGIIMKNTNRLLKTFLCLILFSKSIWAYEVDRIGRWPDNKTTMFVNISGADGLWNQTFEKTMVEWSQSSEFNFFINKEFSDPCNKLDKRNGVAFTKTNCGDEFGSALAITRNFINTITGGKVEADITFDTNKSWDVYDGKLQDAKRGGILYDFHRVALHELGHVLGLGHTPQVSNSIMAPSVSDTKFSLKADDIRGVKALKNINFMNKCINKFPQYIGNRLKHGYQYDKGFTAQKTTGGTVLNITKLALPHDSLPNNTLWYFTNKWHTISLVALGFCN